MQITFQELTIAVGQLKPGRSPGIDGLTSEFYKHFWKSIGMDLYEVFCESYKDGILPFMSACCIDFTTKKGRLEFVKELETCCFINNRI